MLQQLKSVLSLFLVVVLVVSIVGVPVSYHDCSLRGQHNFHAGFFEKEGETHCICCEKEHKEDCCAHDHGHDSCNHTSSERNASFPEIPGFAHTACCKIKTFFLELSTVAVQMAQYIQEAFSYIALFFSEVAHDFIDVARNFSLLANKYFPPDISPNRQADTFLFIQFLL